MGQIQSYDKLNRTPKDLCKSRDLADIISSIYAPSSGEKRRTTFKLNIAAPTISNSTATDIETSDDTSVAEGVDSKYKIENLGRVHISNLLTPSSSIPIPKQQKNHKA